jgi:hypothetical protein
VTSVERSSTIAVKPTPTYVPGKLVFDNAAYHWQSDLHWPATWQANAGVNVLLDTRHGGGCFCDDRETLAESGTRRGGRAMC